MAIEQNTKTSRTFMAKVRQATWSQRFFFGAVFSVALIGSSLIGQGVYIKAKAELAQVLLEKAWNRALAGEATPKAWPWADTWPVAKISVPRLHQTAVVLEGASGEAMAFGPGHMAGTPMPGQPGTSIFAAHRDTHFNFLKNIKTGDIIKVTTGNNQHHTYKVNYLEVVSATASGINPNGSGENLALVTCWPFGERSPGPLRYVVHAARLNASIGAAFSSDSFKQVATRSGPRISLTQ